MSGNALRQIIEQNKLDVEPSRIEYLNLKSILPSEYPYSFYKPDGTVIGDLLSFLYIVLTDIKLLYHKFELM